MKEKGIMRFRRDGSWRNEDHREHEGVTGIHFGHAYFSRSKSHSVYFQVCTFRKLAILFRNNFVTHFGGTFLWTPCVTCRSWSLRGRYCPVVLIGHSDTQRCGKPYGELCCGRTGAATPSYSQLAGQTTEQGTLNALSCCGELVQ